MAEIDDREYAELLAKKAEAETLAKRVETLESEATAKVADLTTKVEQAEAAKVAAETKATAAEAKAAEFEESANKQTLRDERWEKLGSGFTEKIDSMPTTKANLLRDAEAMEDASWDARLKEVEEATATKRDTAKDGKDDDKDGKGDKDGDKENAIFQKEEVAKFQGGAGGSGGVVRQTPGERQSVVAGLAKPPAAKK